MPNLEKTSSVNIACVRRDEIKKALANGTAWFLEAGRLLCEANRERDYLALGYNNQSEWVRSEFNISLSTAHNLMDIWELFKNQPKGELCKAGYTRLTKLLPVVRKLKESQQDEAIQEWLHKAIELPAGAFEDEIKEYSGKIPIDSCDHEFKTLKVCKKCGARFWED